MSLTCPILKYKCYLRIEQLHKKGPPNIESIIRRWSIEHTLSANIRMEITNDYATSITNSHSIHPHVFCAVENVPDTHIAKSKKKKQETKSNRIWTNTDCIIFSLTDQFRRPILMRERYTELLTTRVRSVKRTLAGVMVPGTLVRVVQVNGSIATS